MLIPVILSGGAGTRLWPLSREHYPKQFLPLVGERTMIQDTALRTGGLAGVTGPIVVCNEAHRFLVAEQLRELNITPRAILLEPVRSQYRPCRRGGGARRGRSQRARRRQGTAAAARAAGGPHACGHPGLPARRDRGDPGRARRAPGHLWRRADAAGDWLRLHPAGRRAGRRAAGRGIRREAGCGARHGDAQQRRLFLEQRHVPAAGPGLPGRARAAGSRHACFLPQGLRGVGQRPRFRATRQGCLRSLSGRLDRLRGHGKNRPRVCRSAFGRAGATSVHSPRCKRLWAPTRVAT